MAMSAEPAANLDAACAKIREAAGHGAKVVCLPELFRTPYFCQKEDPELFALAEAIPGPSTEALGWEARRNSVVVVASLFERRAPGPVPQHDRGHRHGRHALGPVPQDAHSRRSGYYEKYYFTPGDLGVSRFPHRVR